MKDLKKHQQNITATPDQESLIKTTKKLSKLNEDEDVRLFESREMTEDDDLVETDRSMQKHTEDEIFVGKRKHKIPLHKNDLTRNSIQLPK